MNVLALYHDMKKRGVLLEASGEQLLVDAPAGELSEQDRAALVEAKPVLLRMLARKTNRETVDDGRRFDARPSRYSGYTGIYDPVDDEWRDFPTKDCFESIVELANRKRRRGGVA